MDNICCELSVSDVFLNKLAPPTIEALQLSSFILYEVSFKYGNRIPLELNTNSIGTNTIFDVKLLKRKMGSSKFYGD